VSLIYCCCCKCRLGGPGEPGDSDRFWRDTFAPFCNAGGVALIAAGNGYEVNGVDRGRDVANPYGMLVRQWCLLHEDLMICMVSVRPSV
jgi:hypothetical protein